MQEILELCEFIYLNSCEDEDQRSIMLFGDLFKLYTRISDKVVGKLNKYAKNSKTNNFRGNFLKRILFIY